MSQSSQIYAKQTNPVHKVSNTGVISLHIRVDKIANYKISLQTELKLKNSIKFVQNL